MDRDAAVLAEALRRHGEIQKSLNLDYQPSREGSTGNPLQMFGSGGYENEKGAKILSGGGQAMLNIPISDRAQLQLYGGGGGAVGSVETPDFKQKIKNFSRGDSGIRFNYQFD
jgi:hypothetical protein